MKTLPLLLLNLATVGGGLVAYDQVIRPTAPSRASVADLDDGGGADVRALARRIEALETRPPTLEALPRRAPSDADIRRLVREEMAGGGGAQLGVVEARNASAGEGAGSLEDFETELGLEGSLDDPTSGRSRFRAMLEAVEAERRKEREVEREAEQQRRMLENLSKLEINLSDAQKAEILAASKTHQEQRRLLFERVRRDELTWDVARPEMEAGRQTFVDSISNIVPNAEDAAKVVRTAGGNMLRRGGVGAGDGGAGLRGRGGRGGDAGND